MISSRQESGDSSETKVRKTNINLLNEYAYLTTGITRDGQSRKNSSSRIVQRKRRFFKATNLLLPNTEISATT